MSSGLCSHFPWVKFSAVNVWLGWSGWHRYPVNGITIGKGDIIYSTSDLLQCNPFKARHSVRWGKCNYETRRQSSFPNSVTRFGEISPFGQDFRSRLQNFESLICILANFEPALALNICYWSIFLEYCLLFAAITAILSYILLWHRYTKLYVNGIN